MCLLRVGQLFLANSGEIEINGIFCVSTEITEITVSTFRLGGDLGR